MRDKTEQLKARIGQQVSRVDALTFYARCGVALLGLIVIYFLWNLFLMGPLNQTKVNLQKKIQLSSSEQSLLASKVVVLRERLSGDKDSSGKQTIHSKIKSLNENIEVFSGQFIPENKMDDVFRDMLAKEKSLKLISIRTGKARPLSLREGQSLKGAHKSIYERNMTMTFQGNYFATMRYLKHLEALKWAIFWDRLSYSVENYPTARVSLTIHTLTQKGARS